MLVLSKDQLIEVLESEKYLESRQRYCARKKEEGYKIYYPEENELLLDFDDEESFQTFKRRIAIIEREAKTDIKWTVFNSTTKGHRHVSVKMPMKIENNYERIAVQAVLGSDPIREMLSLFRAWRDDPHPTLLARKEKPK